MFVKAARPVVVLPVKFRLGLAALPIGKVNAPVIVSPAFNTLSVAEPIRVAVIVPAEKLPPLSLATIVLTVLLLVMGKVVSTFRLLAPGVKVKELLVDVRSFQAAWDPPPNNT